VFMYTNMMIELASVKKVFKYLSCLSTVVPQLSKVIGPLCVQII